MLPSFAFARSFFFFSSDWKFMLIGTLLFYLFTTPSCSRVLCFILIRMVLYNSERSLCTVFICFLCLFIYLIIFDVEFSRVTSILCRLKCLEINIKEKPLINNVEFKFKRVFHFNLGALVV